MEAAAVILALALSALALFKTPLPYAAFAWLCLIPPLCMPYPDRAFLSYLRFACVLFPAFIALAASIKRESTHEAVLGIFAGLYAISAALFVVNQNLF